MAGQIVSGSVKKFCDQITERKRHPIGDELVSLIEALSQSSEKTYVFIDALVLPPLQPVVTNSSLSFSTLTVGWVSRMSARRFIGRIFST